MTDPNDQYIYLVAVGQKKLPLDETADQERLQQLADAIEELAMEVPDTSTAVIVLDNNPLRADVAERIYRSFRGYGPSDHCESSPLEPRGLSRATDVRQAIRAQLKQLEGEPDAIVVVVGLAAFTALTGSAASFCSWQRVDAAPYL